MQTTEILKQIENALWKWEDKWDDILDVFHLAAAEWHSHCVIFVLFVRLKLLFIWCFYLMWAPSEEELWFCPKHSFTIYSAHSFYLASSYKYASAKSKE